MGKCEGPCACSLLENRQLISPTASAVTHEQAANQEDCIKVKKNPSKSKDGIKRAFPESILLNVTSFLQWPTLDWKSLLS